MLKSLFTNIVLLILTNRLSSHLQVASKRNIKLKQLWFFISFVESEEKNPRHTHRSINKNPFFGKLKKYFLEKKDNKILPVTILHFTRNNIIYCYFSLSVGSWCGITQKRKSKRSSKYWHLARNSVLFKFAGIPAGTPVTTEETPGNFHFTSADYFSSQHNLEKFSYVNCGKGKQRQKFSFLGVKEN